MQEERRKFANEAALNEDKFEERDALRLSHAELVAVTMDGLPPQACTLLREQRIAKRTRAKRMEMSDDKSCSSRTLPSVSRR